MSIRTNMNASIVKTTAKVQKMPSSRQTVGAIRFWALVGNIPFTCTEGDLIETFLKIAKKLEAAFLNYHMNRDKDTGIGCGIGFVSLGGFDAISAVEAAIICLERSWLEPIFWKLPKILTRLLRIQERTIKGAEGEMREHIRKKKWEKSEFPEEERGDKQ